jgi:hypothetical protein
MIPARARRAPEVGTGFRKSMPSGLTGGIMLKASERDDESKKVIAL